jgi:hypothetical protein
MNKFFISIFLFITSCSSYSPIAPNIDVDTPFVKGIDNISSDPIVNFKNKLKNRGILLSNDEYNQIKLLRDTKPIKEWISAPNKTSLETLEANFQELSKTIKPKIPESKEEYFNMAFSFAVSENFYAKRYFDIEYYKLSSKIIVVKFDPQTFEFLVIDLYGKISNYQMVNKIREDRYILIPDNL